MIGVGEVFCLVKVEEVLVENVYKLINEKSLLRRKVIDKRGKDKDWEIE